MRKAIALTFYFVMVNIAYGASLDLTVSCYIKGVQDIPVTYYADEKQFADRDKPRVFPSKVSPRILS